MSYAGRLVAMSRGDVPRPAPVQNDAADGLREEQVEATITQPPSVLAAPAAPVAEPRRPAVSTQVERERVRETHTLGETTREIVMATASPEPPRATVQVHEATTVVERVPVPSAPRWLAEDPSAADPLLATADTDALRELMRSVRQWTSSPPTIVEQAEQSRISEPRVEAAPVAEPVQVTIGNVVVTVEDAPAPASRGRSTQPGPTRSVGDRLARNYIRGT